MFSDNDGSSTDSTQPTQLDWQQIIDGIDREMKRLGWSQEIGREYLIKTYGKKSRVKLTDDELMEFWDYLKNK
ncbi:MAG: hypothetical protein QNJ32_18410 [Xenococcaceae cyanobacterium MO_167.B27]|nr:hypothetical protein [Xenococcaceae cyanobacterium MO_167.B27]